MLAINSVQHVSDPVQEGWKVRRHVLCCVVHSTLRVPGAAAVIVFTLANSGW
jgi:hypothetical protein